MVLGKVGLTGATGMLGRHVRAALEAAGSCVVGVSHHGDVDTARWDLAEWLTVDALDGLFGDVKAVVHTGAVVDLNAVGGDEARMFDVNVRACANLSQWALARSIPFVFVSSASVYADPDSGVLSEHSPLGANSLGGFYGMTKLMAEDVLARQRKRGLRLAVMRPSALYGFGGPPVKMLYKFLDAASRGEALELIPPVDDRIDFLHAYDLAAAIVRVLELECWDTFNIASGQPVSISELAAACVEASGRGRVFLRAVRPSGRTPLCRFFLDASEARKRLDWVPVIGLRQGLSMVLSNQLTAQQFAAAKNKV